MTDTPVDIQALAKLARIEVSDDEVIKLGKEIPEILKFVEAIQGADISAVAQTQGLRNVMRDDAAPHESGAFTETLLKAAPAREGNYVAVKQVLSRKNK